MPDFRFELDTAGVRELLLSDEIRGMLEEEAAARLPAGCRIDTASGQSRINVRIVTETDAAYWDNIKNNTLLKAIGGGT